MKIPTAVGEVRATITGDNHAYLEGLVTVRGIQYNANVHIYKQPHGGWGLENANGAGAYISRSGGHDVSRSAKDKVVEAFMAAWKEAAKKNPDVLRQAQRVRLEDDCHRVAEKQLEARKAAEALEVELAALRKAIAALDSMDIARGPYAFTLKEPIL